MLVAMIIAHLLGDYIFQWDALAQWKSQSIKGVLAHGGVVMVTTLAMAAWVDWSWLGWAALIGVSHVAIDVAHFYFCKKYSLSDGVTPLVRFLADQLLHFVVIAIVLQVSGHAFWAGGEVLILRPIGFLEMNPFVVIGYLFLSMPAWILVEFLVFGLLARSAPEFGKYRDKYVGIIERLTVLTLVLAGQLPLIMFVPLPRLIAGESLVSWDGKSGFYLVRLLASFMVALLVGQVIMAFELLN